MREHNISLKNNKTVYESSSLTAYGLFVAAILSISPLVPYVLPINGNIVSLGGLAFILALTVYRFIGSFPSALLSVSFALGLFIYLLHRESSLPLREMILALMFFGALQIALGKRNVEGRRLLFDHVYDALIDIKLSSRTMGVFCFIVVVGLVNSIYWIEGTFKILIYFLGILFISQYLDQYSYKRFVEMSSLFHRYILFGCVIGFVYALLGGGPLFTIANEDGRDNGFYLATFSNTYLLGLIRPSGIYDEPGALSFYICFTVALREIFCLDRRQSWLLLTLGLITGSLAHLIFFVLFVVHVSGGRVLSLVKIGGTIGGIVLIAVSFESPVSVIIFEFAKRLSVEDGVIVGDNRSVLIINAWNYLTTQVFLFGLNGHCIANTPLCDQSQYDQYGENPFTLLVHLGIFISFSYYIVIALLIYYSVKYKNFVVLGVLLLLLQRPNVLSYGYSVIIMLYVLSLLRFGRIYFKSRAHNNLFRLTDRSLRG